MISRARRLCGGDPGHTLRVPHFFALHAMQFVPAFGFMVGKRASPGKAKAFVPAFSAFYIDLVACTFSQALKGQPVLAFIG